MFQMLLNKGDKDSQLALSAPVCSHRELGPSQIIVPTGGRRPREVYHINIRISIFGCSVHQANEIASCFSRATVT